MPDIPTYVIQKGIRPGQRSFLTLQYFASSNLCLKKTQLCNLVTVCNPFSESQIYKSRLPPFERNSAI